MDLGHSWISPDYNLVLGEPMGTNKFINILGPCQIAHLSHKTKIWFMSTLTLKYGHWRTIPQITNIPSRLLNDTSKLQDQKGLRRLRQVLIADSWTTTSMVLFWWNQTAYMPGWEHRITRASNLPFFTPKNSPSININISKKSTI